MDFLEKDLEDIIFSAPHEELSKRGLSIIKPSVKIRQVRMGNYGIADLILYKRQADYYHSYHHFQILELKQNLISESTFFQAIRYATGIKKYFAKNQYYEPAIDIVLIGRNLNKNDSVSYLPDMFGCGSDGKSTRVKIFTYSYDYDGLKFKEECGYQLTNQGF